MSPTAPNVNSLRHPQQLATDIATNAHRDRSVYANRAVSALSSPVPMLRALGLVGNMVIRAADELRTQAAQIRECCTEAHPVPVLARRGDDGPQFVVDSKLAPHHCGRALCDRCERRPETHAKSRMRLGAALTGALLRQATVRFITIPVRNKARLNEALADLDHATLALRKLPEWHHHIRGATRALEVTHNDGIRRRLKTSVAKFHGFLAGRDGRQACVEHVTTTLRDGVWVKETRKRDLTEDDAKAYLDDLHDKGADIYTKTPWRNRYCSKHAAKNCDECDPRGWHPHHHIIAEGSFWLGLCEVCDRHDRYNCAECRAANAKRRKLRTDGRPSLPDETFRRVCGGASDVAELGRLRTRGKRRLRDEADKAYGARMARHGQAFDWLEGVTRGRCLASMYRGQLDKQRVLGESKGYTKRRVQTIARLQRKLEGLTADDYATPARCLSCALSAVTGGESFVVDVRAVKGWAQALKGEPGAVQGAIDGVAAELLKYLTKSAVMPEHAMVEFAWRMRKKRRVSWFGSWHGLELLPAEPAIELKCGTTWGVLWEAWKQPHGHARLYFRGAADLCLAVQRQLGASKVFLMPDPDDDSQLVGSAELGSAWARALYHRACHHVARPPPKTLHEEPRTKKGARSSERAPPAQVLLPY